MEHDVTLKVTGISVDLQRNSVKCRRNRLDIQESRIIMEVKLWKILISTGVKFGSWHDAWKCDHTNPQETVMTLDSLRLCEWQPSEVSAAKENPVRLKHYRYWRERVGWMRNNAMANIHGAYTTQNGVNSWNPAGIVAWRSGYLKQPEVDRKTRNKNGIITDRKWTGREW